MAAATVSDAPVSTRRQEEHLIVPGIGAERPPMAEDDRLTLAPVLEIDLRAILRGDRVHALFRLHVSCQGSKARTEAWAVEPRREMSTRWQFLRHRIEVCEEHDHGARLRPIRTAECEGSALQVGDVVGRIEGRVDPSAPC